MPHPQQTHLEFFPESLEPRRLLAASIYEPGLDPTVGAIVTAFFEDDPADASDPWDIRSNWVSAVDELADTGAAEITFAVYRVVGRNGRMRGGPSVETVNTAVQHANYRGLDVTMLPLFEIDHLGGWRGEFDPTGAARTRFQSEYTTLVADLASIEGVDRMDIASELNAMATNPDNWGFFEELVTAVENTNFSGRIGYVANFDAYNDPQHLALIQSLDIDYLGVSAYFSAIDSADIALVASTGPVSSATKNWMVANLTAQLDELATFADDLDVPVLIQEFGAVKSNYTSLNPWAFIPGDFVGDVPNPYADDPYEQQALYESMLTALDGRSNTFESIHFWAWEHGADRGERSYEGVDPNEQRYLNNFAIWPTDGAGGEVVADFLATHQGSNTAPEIQQIAGPTELLPGISTTFSATVADANDDPIDYLFEILDTTGNVVADATTDRLTFTPASQGEYTLRLRAADPFGNTYATESLRVAPFRIEGSELFVYGTLDDDLIRITPPKGGQATDGLNVSMNGETFAFASGISHIVVSGSDGHDTIRVSGSARLLPTTELYGGSGHDVLFGGRQADKLDGGSGHDKLTGGRGDDILDGGDGFDRLKGGAGDDWLDGGRSGPMTDDLMFDVIVGGSGFDTLIGGFSDKYVGFNFRFDTLIPIVN